MYVIEKCFLLELGRPVECGMPQFNGQTTLSCVVPMQTYNLGFKMFTQRNEIPRKSVREGVWWLFLKLFVAIVEGMTRYFYTFQTVA